MKDFYWFIDNFFKWFCNIFLPIFVIKEFGGGGGGGAGPIGGGFGGGSGGVPGLFRVFTVVGC